MRRRIYFTLALLLPCSAVRRTLPPVTRDSGFEALDRFVGLRGRDHDPKSPKAGVRADAGDRGVPWDAAFEAHYVELCEYVLRFVGSAEAAEDVVQDLFLSLWDTRGPRDTVRLTRPYLYRAARNRALKYLRHRRVADAWIDRVRREEAPRAETPEALLLRRELDQAAERAIAQLPNRRREIFLLRRRDQLSYRDIAARVGVSLGTVKSQMWRATVSLKEALAPYLTPRLP